MNYFFKTAARKLFPASFQLFLSKSYFKITSLLYAGDKYECPCCNGTFRKFLSFDSYGNVRKNARCPKCGLLERQRLLWLFWQRKFGDMNHPLKMLHFAPEPGLQKLFLKPPNIEYISADLASPYAMMKMDITDIPFEKNTFDVIICSHVLNHVNDDYKAMRELARVVKWDGTVIIQTPIDKNREHTFEDKKFTSEDDRKKNYGQIDLARIYGKDFVTRLETSGLNVHIEYFAKKLGAEKTARYGLLDNEEVYLCTPKNNLKI